jgi:hypothetical protein
MATTTVQISGETREMLRSIGGGRPYEETIRELIYHYLDFLSELDARADDVLSGKVGTRPLERLLEKLRAENKKARHTKR